MTLNEILSWAFLIGVLGFFAGLLIIVWTSVLTLGAQVVLSATAVIAASLCISWLLGYMENKDDKNG